MREISKWSASWGVICLLLPTSALAKEKKDELSALRSITVDTKSDDIAVALDGSRAPDFTSFTMSEPFRVVVDWAGSRLDGVKSEQSFDRGLVRRVTTQQFDSEAEKISRVVIELAQKTAYRVEADGVRVIVHFVPVATPIPEPPPEPEPVVKEEAPVEKKIAKYVPEGPLTEPDIPVPSEAPTIVAKAEPKAAPAPAKPEVTVAKTEPAPAPAPATKKAEPKPMVAAVTPPAPKAAPAPEPAPKKAVPSDPVAAVIAPDAPAIPADAPLTEPVMEPAKAAPPKPEPVKEEPVKLAKFVPSEPAPVPEPKVEAPAAAKPTAPSSQRTQQLAAKPDLDSQWSPPAVPVKKTLPVVKLAQADTLEPENTTPADPDVPTMERKMSPAPQTTSAGGADPMDFDPGPRVMTYIGFRQMADVSRVFVRVDGKAKFRVLEEGTRFSLELVDTAVNVKNNERPLDTTYFNSPVTKIKATTTGGGTRVDVELREMVPHQIKRIGSTLAIDFTRR